MSSESTRSISLQPTVAKVINANRFAVLASGLVDEAGAGDDALGVTLSESPDSTTAGAEAGSAAISVALLDGAKVEVEAGATVASDAKVASDATGRAVTAATGDAILGTALIGGAVNEVITIIAAKGAALSA